MRLSELIEGGTDARVTGFAIDSRKVAPGTVFGAFRGTQANGEDYIPQAIAAGAVAIVARPEAMVEGALHIADAEPRRAFARMAAKFFAPFPDTVVAVTRRDARRQLGRQRPSRAAEHCQQPSKKKSFDHEDPSERNRRRARGAPLQRLPWARPGRPTGSIPSGRSAGLRRRRPYFVGSSFLPLFSGM